MKVNDYLLEELKRLNRRNDLLEKEINQSDFSNLAKEAQLKENTLAMCEIAKVYNS